MPYYPRRKTFVRRPKRKPRKAATKRYVKKQIYKNIETQRKYQEESAEDLNSTFSHVILGDSVQSLTQNDTEGGFAGHKVIGIGLKSMIMVRNLSTKPMQVRLSLVWVKHGKVLDLSNYDNIHEKNSGNISTTGTLMDIYRGYDKEILKLCKNYVFTLGAKDSANDSLKPETRTITYYKKLKNAKYSYNGSGINPHSGFLAWILMTRSLDGINSSSTKIEHLAHHTFYYKDI